MLIVLTGFMGSGKSTLLKKIMPNDGWDLDQLLLSSFSYDSVTKLVEERGWDFFRTKERELLLELLNKKEGVIAVGGGALDEEFIDVVKENAKLVWLNTPFEICWQRICGDPNRPLVEIGKEELEKLYHQREKIYKNADLSLDASSQQRVNNTTDLVVMLDEAQRKV